MRNLTYLFLLEILYISCKKNIENKVFVGMNQVNFDYQIEKRIYENQPPPPPFDGENGTLNICIDTSGKFYSYTFKPKTYCGFMLQDIENFEPYRNEMKNLKKDSFHLENFNSLKIKIEGLSTIDNCVSIALPKDTIKNNYLYELLNSIHSKKLSWKLRRQNEIEMSYIK